MRQKYIRTLEAAYTVRKLLIQRGSTSRTEEERRLFAVDGDEFLGVMLLALQL